MEVLEGVCEQDEKVSDKVTREWKNKSQIV